MSWYGFYFPCIISVVLPSEIIIVPQYHSVVTTELTFKGLVHDYPNHSVLPTSTITVLPLYCTIKLVWLLCNIKVFSKKNTIHLMRANYNPKQQYFLFVCVPQVRLCSISIVFRFLKPASVF